MTSIDRLFPHEGVRTFERTDDEIALALRLIPLYQVRLQVDEVGAPMRLWWPLHWRATLTVMLGAERALRATEDAAPSPVPPTPAQPDASPQCSPTLAKTGRTPIVPFNPKTPQLLPSTP